MVILFGFGQHAKNLMDKYYVPINELEIIIDNEICKYNHKIGSVEIISWKDFLMNHENYLSDRIIIGAKNNFEDIKKIILSSETFKNEDILYIDDWIRNFMPMEQNFSYICENEEKRNLRNILDKVGGLSTDVLKNAKCLSNRDEMCKLLPKNMVSAEIGVAYGDFSRIILDYSQPKKFYAIDIFYQNLKGFLAG